MTRGRVSTTSATAPARASPATASATRSSGASTSACSTRPTARHSSGTRAPTRSRARRPCWPSPAACSSAATATTKGGYNVGRIAVFDFSTIPARQRHQHHDRRPDRGPGEAAQRAVHRRPAPRPPPAASTGSSSRSSTGRRNRYLADNLTTWQTANNTIVTTLGHAGRDVDHLVAAVDDHGATGCWSSGPVPSATTEARTRRRPIKKFETFDLSDQPPDANVNGPSGSIVASTTFTITGSATDDVGVQSISLTLQDAANNRYLQNDGSVAPELQQLHVEPDVVGATNTTWSYDVDGALRGRVDGPCRGPGHRRAVLPRHRRPHLAGGQQRHRPDGHGQRSRRHDAADLGTSPSRSRRASRSRSRVTPRTTRTSPRSRSSCATTPRGERLAADGTWNNTVQPGWYRISPLNINGRDYNWSYTTPFNLTPGSYSFTVQAVDDLGLETIEQHAGSADAEREHPRRHRRRTR